MCLSITEGLGGNGGYLEGAEQFYTIEEYNLDGSENHTLKNILTNTYGFKESFLKKNIIPELCIYLLKSVPYSG